MLSAPCICELLIKKIVSLGVCFVVCGVVRTFSIVWVVRTPDMSVAVDL